MITQVITFWGIVQGVGFRPTLSRLAGIYGYKGQIRNMGALVQLIVTDSEERIDAFVDIIRREKPLMAEINRIDRETIDTVYFSGFTIEASAMLEDEITVIPADIAICEKCLEELRDPNNIRFKHPFISCSDCGPRYTIIKRLPYDRDTTTMADYSMCPICSAEYKNPKDRRYHAQTVSCFDCGPQPILFVKGGNENKYADKSDKDKQNVDKQDKDKHGRGKTIPPEIYRAALIIKEGGIIALKGTGGYYFVCSPYKKDTVARLRELKVREEKPFAVMFADVASVTEHCTADKKELELLSSPRRPIVLLEKKGEYFAENVCNNSRFVGAFFPSFAMQYLLLDECGPLIMTSANLSDLPIIKDDGRMLKLADSENSIDAVLYHTRDIVERLDDSVARVIDGSEQLIRRARGWTPVPVFVRKTQRLTNRDMILATGGDLKSAFAVSKGSFSTLSQYIGDLDDLETEEVYKKSIDRMTDFFKIKPDIVVCDLHPGYRSSAIAREYADDRKLPLLPVQHHHAHIASVMAEHGITGPVIGIAFDGTGYGTDGNIWGGEILICEADGFRRFSHLSEIEMIGGDSSMKDGWKSALSHMYAYSKNVKAIGENNNDTGETITKTKKQSSEEAAFEIDISEIISYSMDHSTLAAYRAESETVKAAIESGSNTIKTTSIGRLFDAVSSLLGIHHINRYEGECAIMLENAAARSLTSDSDEVCRLALNFHLDVAKAVLGQCEAARERFGIDQVALSGGVFQNKILTEEILKLLRVDSFDTYINRTVPPNDGGIALGQNYIAMMQKMNGSANSGEAFPY